MPWHYHRISFAAAVKSAIRLQREGLRLQPLSQKPQAQSVFKNVEEKTLANVKSAKKRIIVNQKKADRNKAIRSRVKTYVKKVYEAIEAGDKAQAQEALRLATKELDKAATKGVYHKNMTSRKVSRLAQAVNKMA